MSSLCCLDTSGLLALEQSPTRSTRWVLLAQPPPAPAVASPSAAHRDDEAREELEEGAAEEFADEVGGDVRSAELRAWRAAYIRRRLTCVVRGAQGALTGTAPAANTDDARVATRRRTRPTTPTARGQVHESAGAAGVAWRVHGAATVAPAPSLPLPASRSQARGVFGRRLRAARATDTRCSTMRHSRSRHVNAQWWTISRVLPSAGTRAAPRFLPWTASPTPTALPTMVSLL